MNDNTLEEQESFLDLKEINWLASFPKSGNTWVRMLIQAHAIGALNINSNLRLTYADALPHHYDGVVGLPLDQLAREHRLLLRASALINMISERPQKPLIVKTHMANVRVNSVSMIPNELTQSSVYLMRDPRDVVISYARYLDKSIDETIRLMSVDSHFLDNYGRIPQPVCSWSSHVVSWQRLGPLVVKYEDMLEDAGYWFKQMLELWGLPTDDYEKAVDLASFNNLQKQEKDMGFIENMQDKCAFFKVGKKGQWKKDLTKKQIEKIEEQHGETMQKFGYV